MTEKQAIRDIMGLRKVSQSGLAEIAGFKHQTNVSNILNKGDHGVRFDILYKIMNALDCDIIIRDRQNPDNTWLIDMNEDSMPNTEELLRANKITFDEAVKRGWKPSAEMLSKMLS